MNVTCPHCYSSFVLDAGTEDHSARRLFFRLGEHPAMAAPLVAYLGLFKPRVQALRWSRALALADEVLAWDVTDTRLARALVETVESLRERRQGENWKPLTNHRYLLSVLENTRETSEQPTMHRGGLSSGASKTAQAIDMVRAYSDPARRAPEWFVSTIKTAFERLLLLRLDGAPAADTVVMTLDYWIDALWPKRAWNETDRFHGADRLRVEIERCARSEPRRWPQPDDILARIPKA